jgi:transcriptional regulator with GAF, ATPase, and Fis domain
MRATDGKAIAYMIAGPVIVNKRLDKDEYLELSRKFNQDYDDMMNIIDEVRIVSFINLKSILDLLSQVAQHLTELSIGRYELISEIQNQNKTEINRSGKAQSLIEAILNLAILISEAEAGSIMTYNQQTEDLTVVASQGLNPSAAQNRTKLGEGIAGMAAQEQETYVIHGQNASSNRIKHLLRRPEIKHSIVMPIALENRVVGVLNLHTTKENPRMSGDMEDILRHLSQLTSVAFQSL